MGDRIGTRLFARKIDPHVQSLVGSPYIRQHIQLAGLINHRDQMISYNDYLRNSSHGKRQRREREAITQEIVSRAVKIDRTHRLSRRHQFEVAARRVVSNNLDILSRKYRKQSETHKKTREKSAPSISMKGENNVERRSRVTSAGNKQFGLNNDLVEPHHEGNQNEPMPKSSLIHVERHACEVTMSYRSKTTTQNEDSTRDEIVVMQQHRTGENLIVYRGFLAKGEFFAFKSQRRPTSALSLAFYAKGFIDSVVNDCCEFRYGRRNQQTNEHGQFWLERVRKASPCEKCRRRYSQVSPAQTETVRQRYLTTEQEHAIDENTNKDRQVTNEQKSKRISSAKKQLTKERSGVIDFSLLESALVHQNSSTTHFIPVASNNTSTANEESTKQELPFERDQTPPQWDNSSENTTMINPGNMFQLVMAQLQQQLQEHQAQSATRVRHEKSVENFIYIIDGNLSFSNKEKRKLHGLINFGSIFHDMNDGRCLEFINQIINEQIIMILSRSSMQNLDPTIRNAAQLCLIYIVDNSKDGFADSEKIRGIHTNLANVRDQLEKDMKLLTDDLTTILSVAANDTSDSNFAYVQVLKDILLETDEKMDLKKEMLDFCRQAYADNEIQLKLIDEFEHHFRPDQAVQWYSRQETFLFKMLIRAFRVPDPDILFKLRFFIQYLHRQLKLNLSPTSLTVYRTQQISNDDLETILKDRGGFLAFNQFLLTNKVKSISKRRKNDLPWNNSDSKLVVFQMELGPTTPRMALETNSDEILITTATIFRISNVEQIDKEISLIKLTSNDEVFKAAQELIKSMRETARGPFPLLRIAKLMKQMEFIYYTEYFCLLLIDDPMTTNNDTANLVLGGLFHTLCSFYYEQEQYDRALEQLEKSLKAYLRVLPPDDIKLTPTYNNMGSIYHKQGLDERALLFHQKAYDIQVKSSNPDPDSVAAYAGNIASVLIKQNKFEEAIPYLQLDLQIRQRLYPNEDDINLAVKYHNLAGAQFRINKFIEALDNYKKCLDIELKVHPANHPTVAVTYYNMATALEGLGKLQEAIETIQKARKRLLLTRDENDEEVKMHQEYEQRLQQKLWVKSLFGTN